MKNLENKESQLKPKDTKKVKRLSTNESGPLYIDDKYKEEGYVYRIVDASRSGRVQQLEKLGYSLVVDPDLEVGDSATKQGGHGKTVTMKLGGRTSDRDGVLMRIPKEIHEEIQAEKEENNLEIDRSLGTTGVPTQYGEITIGNKTIK